MKCQVADVTELDLPEASADVVFSNWLLMYLSDEECSKLARDALRWVSGSPDLRSLRRPWVRHRTSCLLAYARAITHWHTLPYFRHLLPSPIPFLPSHTLYCALSPLPPSHSRICDRHYRHACTHTSWDVEARMRVYTDMELVGWNQSLDDNFLILPPRPWGRAGKCGLWVFKGAAEHTSCVAGCKSPLLLRGVDLSFNPLFVLQCFVG